MGITFPHQIHTKYGKNTPNLIFNPGARQNFKNYNNPQSWGFLKIILGTPIITLH